MPPPHKHHLSNHPNISHYLIPQSFQSEHTGRSSRSTCAVRHPLLFVSTPVWCLVECTSWLICHFNPLSFTFTNTSTSWQWQEHLILMRHVLVELIIFGKNGRTKATISGKLPKNPVFFLDSVPNGGEVKWLQVVAWLV